MSWRRHPAPPLFWQVGFFAELGDCLREAIAEQLAHPERYADERSVMRVYLEVSSSSR